MAAVSQGGCDAMANAIVTMASTSAIVRVTYSRPINRSICCRPRTIFKFALSLSLSPSDFEPIYQSVNLFVLQLSFLLVRVSSPLDTFTPKLYVSIYLTRSFDLVVFEFYNFHFSLTRTAHSLSLINAHFRFLFVLFVDIQLSLGLTQYIHTHIQYVCGRSTHIHAHSLTHHHAQKHELPVVPMAVRKP